MSNVTAAEAAPRNGSFSASADTRSDFERLLDKPLPPSKPPTEIMADFLGVPRDQLVRSLKQIVMPAEANDSDFLAFCQVAARYKLNPFLREIFPVFSKKTGKMTVVVPIDGWITIVQRERNYDGVEYREVADDDGDKPVVTFCTIYRKDKSHATIIPERYSECVRDSEPWRTMPFRMLRHKAFIQCARVAFGIGGISDEEEAATAAGYPSINEALADNLGPQAKKRSLLPPTATPKNDASPAGDAPAAPAALESAPVPSSPSPTPAAILCDECQGQLVAGETKCHNCGHVAGTPVTSKPSPRPGRPRRAPDVASVKTPAAAPVETPEPAGPSPAEKILDEPSPEEKVRIQVDEADAKSLYSWILTMKAHRNVAAIATAAIERHAVQGMTLAELPPETVKAIALEIKIAMLNR